MTQAELIASIRDLLNRAEAEPGKYAITASIDLGMAQSGIPGSSYESLLGRSPKLTIEIVAAQDIPVYNWDAYGNTTKERIQE